MYLPSLQSISTSEETIDSFVGFYSGAQAVDGAFGEMTNLSANAYPHLTTRTERVKCADIGDASGGIYAKTQLAWASNGELFYQSQYVGDVSAGEKQFIGMGAFLLVWPDKKMYNTNDTPDGSDLLQDLERNFTSTTAVSFTITRLGGDDYPEESIHVGDSAPDDPTEYPYWVDTSSTPNAFQVYSSATESWSALDTVYVKVTSDGIGEGLDAYDAVTIGGCTNEDFNESFCVYECDTDYIKIAYMLSESFSQQVDDGAITCNRTVPDMEFLTECNNRIWGCNSDNNEIYACALGNPKNWNRFIGLTDDSYAVTVGSDGSFTGAVTYNSTLYFFKEDMYHKIYGTAPSSFTTSTSICRGVQMGSEKSLCICNEILYYKSRTGVCAFDGSTATIISDALGTSVMYDAVGGQWNNYLYVSMRDSDDVWALYVYSVKYGVWYREDDFHAVRFATLDGDLFALDAQGVIWCLSGNQYFYSDTELETDGPLSWEATTREMGTSSFDAKYLSKIKIRLWLPTDSTFSAAIEYDDSGEFDELLSLSSMMNQAYSIPVRLRRCDHFKLKISGEGEFKLLGIAKVLQNGSEVKRHDLSV